MAIRPNTVTSKKKQPGGSETSVSIEEKTKAFLKSGGEIQQIRSGVSGQQSMMAPKPVAAAPVAAPAPVVNKEQNASPQS